MSVTARSERPMSRWISWVRPDTLPRFTSRGTRSGEERGIIAYSAVTQPVPRPAIQRGTEFSMVAVQMILVDPISMRQDPSA
jgi:hypothetical protein